MNIKEKLYAPIEDINSRKGRGGTYDYVKWQSVADRMNEVFGMSWSSSVEYQDVISDNLIMRVSVCAKNPDTGETFCQEGYGGAVLRNGDEPGNAHKSAYSKALKDACKKWGVGLHIDGADEEPMGYPQQAPQTQRAQAPQQSMPSQGMMPPAGNNAPQNFNPSAPKQQGPTPMPPQQSAPSRGGNNMAPVTNGGSRMPSGGGYSMPTPPQQQQAPKAANGPFGDLNDANYPEPKADMGYAPDPTVPGNTQTQPVETPTNQGINTVQEMAIKNMASIKGASNEEQVVQLINGLSDSNLGRTINKLKDLTYNEAVTIIKTIKQL